MLRRNPQNDTRVFRSNALQRLGIENDKFKNTLNEMAFSFPSLYFSTKKTYFKSLVEDLVSDLHKTIFDGLTTGKDKDGNDIVDVAELDNAGFQGFRGGFSPQISEEYADKLALDLCLTLKNQIESKIIDAIFTTPQIQSALEKASRSAELQMK